MKTAFAKLAFPAYVGVYVFACVCLCASLCMYARLFVCRVPVCVHICLCFNLYESLCVCLSHCISPFVEFL